MGEKPILFSGDMIKAILAGRKTQTRRVIKPQPPDGGRVSWLSKSTETDAILDWAWWDALDRIGGCVRCPYGQPGDRLWVREMWRTVNLQGNQLVVQYKADGRQSYPKSLAFSYTDHVFEVSPGVASKYSANFHSKWRPSIFMPRWASRITLKITDVRVERVQDIKPVDAMAEGIEVGGDYGPLYITRFETLWDSINAKRGYGWTENPWVWVIEFRRI